MTTVGLSRAGRHAAALCCRYFSGCVVAAACGFALLEALGIVG